jgi:hypothetical protein
MLFIFTLILIFTTVFSYPEESCVHTKDYRVAPVDSVVTKDFSIVAEDSCKPNSEINYKNGKPFIESFIKHYEFNPEGRYVHEYHPFVLDRTAQSLDRLVKKLKQSDLCVKGRNVIFGYEENSLPTYYTNFKDAKINDEACIENKVGWSLKLHNRFGFMTAFLFKDVNEMCSQLLKSKSSRFYHVDAELITLFDDHANVFQVHALGQVLDLIVLAYPHVMKNIRSGNSKNVFSNLIEFWEILYKSSLKIGNQQIAGTQDVLFSIEYARYALRSDISLTQFFIGPDITYPIEVFCKQVKEVTRHAQQFVSKFVESLQPVDGDPTVYIFCSFVDGVGKSTMLGNIKNWMKFGSSVDKFEHVDNSSSQLAEVFKFKEDVFIADLPAQMSHFTYKPDGLVFVDYKTECNHQKTEKLKRYVRENSKNLEKQYHSNFLRTKNIIDQSGFFDDELNSSGKPDLMFIRNLFLLKKEKDNNWIPFVFDYVFHLFNRENLSDIRVLVNLADAKSEGLKNIESEQMLFTKGIRFPLPYDVFLNDLVDQLKKQGVKNVVFVDFFSMYPRSSRENVRINYLLQQMALLDKTFDVKNSMYRNFVSGGELLNCLYNKKVASNILKFFNMETFVRMILYFLILERKEGGLSGFEIKDLTDKLSFELKRLPCELLEFLDKISTAKMFRELKVLEEEYGMSKSFVNVQQFSFDAARLLSDVLQEFFTSNLQCDRLNKLWDEFGMVSDDIDNKINSSVDYVCKTNCEEFVRVLYKFYPECRTELLLEPFLKSLRASWYASLISIFESTSVDGKSFIIEDEAYRGIPMMLQKGLDNVFRLMHRDLPFVEATDDIESDEWFRHDRQLDCLLNIPYQKHSKFVEFLDEPYRFEYGAANTSSGFYAFDCNLSNNKKNKNYISLVSRVVKRHQEGKSTAVVMSTTDLCESLFNSEHWKMEENCLRREAERNGLREKPEEENNEIKKNSDTAAAYSRAQGYKPKNGVFLAKNEQRLSAQMFIRLAATIEMIVKDPDADVVVRFGDREDFKSALLLFEKVTIPKYFKIFFKDNLFDDYDSVEPYPSWDFWDSI